MLVFVLQVDPASFSALSRRVDPAFAWLVLSHVRRDLLGPV